MRAASAPARPALARPALELRDLLIYEGQPPQYVAEQLGHSAATLLRDYARVWEDFDPSQRVSAEEQIERVRRRLYGRGTTRGGERSGGRRARSAFPTAAGVPEVFRARFYAADPRKDETPD
jgi:hypothetical protein